MEDAELRRLAEEWLSDWACDYCTDARIGLAPNLAGLLCRVAEEARRQERERIEGIVRAVEPNYCACAPTYTGCQSHGICDEILRRIKGE